jgi:hypothetical protein
MPYVLNVFRLGCLPFWILAVVGLVGHGDVCRGRLSPCLGVPSRLWRLTCCITGCQLCCASLTVRVDAVVRHCGIGQRSLLPTLVFGTQLPTVHTRNMIRAEHSQEYRYWWRYKFQYPTSPYKGRKRNLLFCLSRSTVEGNRRRHIRS